MESIKCPTGKETPSWGVSRGEYKAPASTIGKTPSSESDQLSLCSSPGANQLRTSGPVSVVIVVTEAIVGVGHRGSIASLDLHLTRRFINITLLTDNKDPAKQVKKLRSEQVRNWPVAPG